MHYNPQPQPGGVVGSEPSHCYRTVFLSFSSDKDHSRSRSLNDIDCGLQFQGVYQCQNYVRSKSSDEALEAVAQTRTYPLTPCQAPFFRSPTPNGLPEFGSREAQELRLVPPSRLHRLAEALQKRVYRIQHNQESNREDERGRITSSQETETAHPIRAQPESVTDILRRMVGTATPVFIPKPPEQPRRASLPKGIVRVSQPGALTQAADGSQVRGRFSSRTSGHGIGQRTIGIHPLARMSDSSGLQDAIEEIEKACADEDARQQRNAHQERRERRRTSASATRQYQGLDLFAIEALVAAQALDGEWRAVGALERQQREARGLGAQFKTLTTPSTSLNARVKHLHSSTSNAEHRLAQLRQLAAEDMNASPHLQISNDQTVTSFLPNENSRRITPIDMIEPALYSSYSSFSYSSDEMTRHRQGLVGGDLPVVDSMFEYQGPESASNTAEEPQRLSVPQKLALDLC